MLNSLKARQPKWSAVWGGWGAVLVLLISGCSGLRIAGVDLGKVAEATSRVADLGDKSEQEEQELGTEIAEMLLDQSALMSNEAIQRYVNKVGQWVAKHSERPNLPWRFIVLDDPGFNAFAAPGGYVFITKGALIRLGSEAELASILAHEMAHVLDKHYLEAIKSQAQIGIAVDLGTFAYQVARAQSDSSGASSDELVAAEKLASAVNDLYAKGLERGDELSADAKGMVLAARAGYDPYAYVAVLQKIASVDGETNIWSRFNRRHPPAQDRIEALSPVMDAPFASAEGYQALADRYFQYVR